MTERSNWIAVGTVAELASDSARGFVVGEGEWPLRGVMLRDANDVVRAYVNRCPHAGHALDMKEHDFLTSDGNFIKCASHGALFARDSGLCIAGPCAGRSLQRLEVSVDGVTVRIGTPITEP